MTKKKDHYTPQNHDFKYWYHTTTQKVIVHRLLQVYIEFRMHWWQNQLYMSNFMN